MIERQSEVSDGAGGYTKSWSTLATVDGGIVAMSGDERFASGRTEARSKWRLLIPYQASLTEKDRISIDGRAYNVTFVNDVQKRGQWHMLDLGEGFAT